MNRPSPALRTLIILVFAVLVIVVLLAAGWWPSFDPSVELSDRFGKIQNGSAYDGATMALDGARKLVLPDNAIIRRTGAPGEVRLFMKKTLHFAGHPPRGMGIADARANMGCAVKTDGDVLAVATFGEWDSHIEGGADMQLVVVVPQGVEVEQREGLSGPDSAGSDRIGRNMTDHRGATGGYWYGAAAPAEGWQAVLTVPDPGRTAR